LLSRTSLSLQRAAFFGWLVLVVSPVELPDPLGLGLPFSLTALCLLASAIIWAPDLLAGHWPSTAIDPVLALYLMFVVIASTVNNPVTDPHNTSVAVLSLAGNVGMFYATVVLARKAPQIAHDILLLLIASIAMLMVMALAYHAEMGLSTRPKVYLVPEGWGGYPELGTLAALQFGLLVAALQTTGSKAMFLVTALLIVVNLVELSLLYSRGAWLAVGVVMLAAVGVMARRGQWARAAGIAGILAVAGLVLFLSNPTLRYLTMTVTGGTAPAWARDGAVAEVAAPDSRMQIWERSVQMILDHPLRGVGPGDFEDVFQANYVSDPNEDLRRAGVHAHNLWLHQFAELGLAGGAAYAALWVAVLRLGWRSARERPGFLSVGLFLAIAAAAGSNVSTHMFFLTSGGVGRLHSLTWMLFGLTMATQRTGEGLRLRPDRGAVMSKAPSLRPVT
jgi:O-antigen ligase